MADGAFQFLSLSLFGPLSPFVSLTSLPPPPLSLWPSISLALPPPPPLSLPLTHSLCALNVQQTNKSQKHSKKEKSMFAKYVGSTNGTTGLNGTNGKSEKKSKITFRTNYYYYLLHCRYSVMWRYVSHTENTVLEHTMANGISIRYTSAYINSIVNPKHDSGTGIFRFGWHRGQGTHHTHNTRARHTQKRNYKRQC